MKQIYFVFIFAAILFSCNNNVKTEKIKIATAANMQFAMDSLVQIFELETAEKYNEAYSEYKKLISENNAEFENH